MNISPDAQRILATIDPARTKLGDLRKIAKEIKKDHALAMELWSTGEVLPRQLAILIMDKKLLSQDVIDGLCADIEAHGFDDQCHLIDWLMANQLSKDKKTVAMMESWRDSPSALQRRLFWYHQARLRWMGKTGHDNTDELLGLIEDGLAGEQPMVQWAMNFTAGQIGKFEAPLRPRCIALGERIGLYKDEMVAKNCTPSYLPEFIRIEVAKLSG
ncbi:MAG: DNA alkylation repair protein [Hellea sp.]|nr:DNA alkylation repair protein [Hellea sp.]